MFDWAPYISLLVSIAAVVGNWMIFKKMGEPGWKAIIPVYNYYIICKKVWSIKPFIIEIISGIVLAGSLIMSMYLDSGFNVFFIMAVPVLVITDLCVRYHLKQAFDKSGWFFCRNDFLFRDFFNYSGI